MNKVYAKLRQKQSDKYRKILSIGEDVYPECSSIIRTAFPYSNETILDNQEWFFVEEVSKQPFAVKEISGLNESRICSVDYKQMERSEFSTIDYFFVDTENWLCFQKVSKTKLLRKKVFYVCGTGVEFKSDCQEISVNEVPDAIYDKCEDRLYFRRLQSITSIFKGIDKLYREATDDEVQQFLENDFISLGFCFSKEDVNVSNRKRIALAMETLSKISKSDQRKIFSYVAEYCPKLKLNTKKFKIESDGDLKMLLFGIEQRFYTTPVGNERRVANSIVKL